MIEHTSSDVAGEKRTSIIVLSVRLRSLEKQVIVLCCVSGVSICSLGGIQNPRKAKQLIVRQVFGDIFLDAFISMHLGGFAIFLM